jgi:porin
MPIGLSWSRTCLSAAVLAATTVAAFAADPAPSAPASAGSLLERQTLTGDWFGRGQAMRDAGLDLRVEWSQFYQGLTSGNGAKHWLYAGKLDAQARIDLSKLGF